MWAALAAVVLARAAAMSPIAFGDTGRIQFFLAIHSAFRGGRPFTRNFAIIPVLALPWLSLPSLNTDEPNAGLRGPHWLTYSIPDEPQKTHATDADVFFFFRQAATSSSTTIATSGAIDLGIVLGIVPRITSSCWTNQSTARENSSIFVIPADSHSTFTTAKAPAASLICVCSICLVNIGMAHVTIRINH